MIIPTKGRLPWSYHGPTTVLPWSYRGPTTVLPWSYHGPTMVLPWSYHGPTTVLPWSYHGPTTVLPWSYGFVVELLYELLLTSSTLFIISNKTGCLMLFMPRRLFTFFRNNLVFEITFFSKLTKLSKHQKAVLKLKSAICSSLSYFIY